MEISEEELIRIQEKIDKLKQSKFKQQMLPAWRPVPSFGSTMVIFGIFGVLFLSLGVTLYVMSEKIDGITLQYDGCVDNPSGETMQCTKEFTLSSDIQAPVYVYYQLDNFYQNHRRYVKSRSNQQLMGNDLSLDDLTDCQPVRTNAQMGKDVSVNGTPLIKEDAAYPCGLVAKSFFNDTFALQDVTNNKKIDINSENIAWESDREYKFKNMDGDWQSKQWHDVTDPHFIVWMRTAGLPNFRKLYGEIGETLEKGNYELTIEDSFNVSSFQGSKYFVMSTTNLLGGQNYFLAICYIVVGALCLMFAVIFFIAYMGRKSSEGGVVEQN